MRRAFTLFHQIIHSQDIRAETQSWSRPAEAQVHSEVNNLQAELQNTLRALQQQQDPANLLDDDKVHEAAFHSRYLGFKTFKERGLTVITFNN